MKKRAKIFAISVSPLVFGMFYGSSYAQSNLSLTGFTCSLAPRNFKELVMNMFIGCIINPLVPVLMAVAVLAFLWGVFTFIRAEGDNKKKAKDFIIYGIIGLFVMVSVWGLVNILQYTFRLNDTQIQIRPVNVPTP